MATVEIGVEVKILAKAMIKQIDRVQSDLAHQAQQFRHRAGSSQPICVGIVGINYADVTTSYEGDRSYRTDGGKYKHPVQEAEQARLRLAAVARKYDEFLILKYRARNEPPYSFEWVNQKDTAMEYGAALIRISNEYQRRFFSPTLSLSVRSGDFPPGLPETEAGLSVEMVRLAYCREEPNFPV